MDLVIDTGNSRAKLAFFEGDRLLERRTVPADDGSTILALAAHRRPARIAWGSTARVDEGQVTRLQAIAPVLLITGSTPSPLINSYSTPLTLGADRLANAVAASAAFPGRAVLVVDLGTCITYDLVDASRNYRGGAISPGVRMRAQAMHEHSARLPLVEPNVAPSPFAGSTVGALQAGIHHGVLGEIRAFIHHLGHEAADGAVVLTGGDAPTFARALKSGIFAHPFLTLEGYRLILEHQASGGPHRGGDPVSGDRAGTTG